MNEIVKIYSNSQQGGELPYFIGKQYGSGWLQSLGRFAFPILKNVGSSLLKFGSDVLLNNQEVGPALKANALIAAKNILPTIANTMQGKRKSNAPTPINKGKRRKTIFR